MKKTILLAIFSFAFVISASAYDYTDDIYYNPKKEKTSSNKEVSKGGQYLVDFSTMDVDEYNKRGQYFYSPLDTIGTFVENEPDFVYTTQIQKYYNPTIVTDNADLIQDVLNNSYGNVEIVYNYNGGASFVPVTYVDPYYYNYSWYSPWSWSFNFGPFGWNIGWNNWWNWGPSWNWGWNWAWNWGPSWNWGWGSPAWRPGWGPGWGPGPGGPHHPGPQRPMATYSPGGRAPFGGNQGALAGHNPNGGNFNGNSTTGRPGAQPPRRQNTPTIQHGNNLGNNNMNPSSASPGKRPSGSSNYVPSRPSQGPQTLVPSGSRPSTSTTRPATSTTRPATGTSTSRPSTGVTNSKPSTSTSRPSTSTQTAPHRESTTTSRPSTSSPSRNGSMNSGGSRGGFGGSSSGGGSRGGFGGGGSRSGGRR